MIVAVQGLLALLIKIFLVGALMMVAVQGLLALLIKIFLVGALIIVAVQDLLVERHDQEDDLLQTANL